MDDVISLVMTFAMMRNVNDAQFEETSRIKLANYIDELTSAGQHDKQHGWQYRPYLYA